MDTPGAGDWSYSHARSRNAGAAPWAARHGGLRSLLDVLLGEDDVSDGVGGGALALVREGDADLGEEAHHSAPQLPRSLGSRCTYCQTMSP